MNERGRILIMSSPVLITVLLTGLACVSGTATTTWGNERETFTMLLDGARFEGLCVEGVIAEKVAVDQAGMFSARGTLRQLGGRRRDDDGARDVVFRGTISGETMTLSIEGADHVEIGKSTLRRGVHGTAHPCA